MKYMSVVYCCTIPFRSSMTIDEVVVDGEDEDDNDDVNADGENNRYSDISWCYIFCDHFRLIISCRDCL